MKTYRIFIIILFISSSSWGQSLIVGIPSADVAEKNHLEVTHETQWNFWEKPPKWNSFNFACFGLGKGTELTATLNNLNNEGSTNVAVGVGLKKVFNLAGITDVYERKFVIGSNLLYATNKQNLGVWSYALSSFRLPKAKTRFTGGLSYGNSQTFGFRTRIENGITTTIANNKLVFLGGIEQPIAKNLSIICDWYSGSHDLAAFIPAMQLDIGHSVLIVGYKIPNNMMSGNQALILECMISLPTKK